MYISVTDLKNHYEYRTNDVRVNLLGKNTYIYECDYIYDEYQCLCMCL